MVRVKVCGVTSLDDARACVEAGVDAIGLNFWAKSVRRCDERVARAIVDAYGGTTLMVGVFVDESELEIARIRAEVGVACVQLHGDEPPELVQRFLPHAYKALRVQDASVVEHARRFPGEYVLLDAYVKGMPGGTGATFDWKIARSIASERKLTLAGGLTADNVAEAVRAVRPYCVDTASGVESAPGVKDADMVRAFVQNARGA
ncbi:MAG: phosphoribosylanthranilate isomerase [Polyangiales bacterium]